MLTVDAHRSDRTQSDRVQINPSLAESCKDKLRATFVNIFNQRPARTPY